MLVLDEVLRRRVDLTGAHARFEIPHGLQELLRRLLDEYLIVFYWVHHQILSLCREVRVFDVFVPSSDEALVALAACVAVPCDVVMVENW